MLLFNRYEYNPQADLIGKGGFARVYKALDKELNSTVALKIWKTGAGLSAPHISLADRQKLIGLSHPNLGSYLAIEEMEKEDAFGETELIQVCVLEWLKGITLAQYAASSRDLPVLKKLLAGVSGGLSYLHSNGVVHGNITVSNIFVLDTAEGPVAKLADFGIFKPGVGEREAFEADVRSLTAVFDAITPAIASSDDTQILIPKPKPAAASVPSDDTQVLPARPTPATAPVPSDDTQILIPQPKPASVPVSSDDTQLLTDDTQLLTPKPKPIAADETQLLPKPLPVSSDDTQILPAKPKPTVAPVASDDTQILPSRPTPTPAAAAATDETQLLSRPSPRREELLSLFNRYEYNPNTGLIGKGGFSRVYKAFDKKLNRWVALKIYKGGEFADRYSPIAEIRRVVNLDHSNICRYLDIEEIEKENSFGERETTQICVMELLDGGNFTEYYNANRSDSVLKKLLNDVLTGIAYLHKNGIIHRDIKPANILIKETLDGPVAKITDFGISKKSDSVNNNSSSALIVSIPYMAPEQLNVKKYGVNEKISYNLDLWSLGVTIYEVVTGKVLFKNSDQDSSEQIMTNIMAPELPEKIRELPQPFRDIVSHCIVKDAKDRAQKAEELIVLLHSNYDDADPVLPVAGPARVADAVTTPRAKEPVRNSFFIENEKEEKKSSAATSSGATGKKVNERKMLFIGLGAGFIIVIITLIFFAYRGGNKNESVLAAPAKKADSAATVSTTVTKAPATIPAASKEPQGSLSAKTDSPPASQPVSAAPEKRPRKTVSGSEEAAAPSSNSGSQKYVLLLTTTQSCTVKLNEEDYGKLEAGKTLKVFLVPGTYVLKATSLSNSASVYTGNLEVSEKNRSQVGQYRIPMP
ncbi:MAG TPA: protein kinase [Puia sp.]|nr:protein kinase [Puia sp.]